MANYNDYELESQEDAAVQRSKNMKRAAIAGAAVLGVGGTAAYGVHNAMAAENGESELTSEDVLGAADAAGIDETVVETAPQEVHVHEHRTIEVPENQAPKEEPLDVDVEETAIVYDEDGNIAYTADAGTINGNAFVVMDTDLNGKGDVLAYDANGNGRFEDNEIVNIDNNTYDMGQGKNLAVYVDEGNGPVRVYDNAEIDPMAEIHNDFDEHQDSKGNEYDLAENNPDYDNRGGDQYSVGMAENSEIQIDPISEPEGLAENYDLDGPSISEPIDYSVGDENDLAYNEPVDYGYTETADNSIEAPTDTFDDNTYDVC